MWRRSADSRTESAEIQERPSAWSPALAQAYLPGRCWSESLAPQRPQEVLAEEPCCVTCCTHTAPCWCLMCRQWDLEWPDQIHLQQNHQKFIPGGLHSIIGTAAVISHTGCSYISRNAPQQSRACPMHTPCTLIPSPKSQGLRHTSHQYH